MIRHWFKGHDKNFIEPWQIISLVKDRVFAKRAWICNRVGCPYFSVDYEYMYISQAKDLGAEGWPSR